MDAVFILDTRRVQIIDSLLMLWINLKAGSAVTDCEFINHGCKQWIIVKLGDKIIFIKYLSVATNRHVASLIQVSLAVDGSRLTYNINIIINITMAITTILRRTAARSSQERDIIAIVIDVHPGELFTDNSSIKDFMHSLDFLCKVTNYHTVSLD